MLCTEMLITLVLKSGRVASLGWPSRPLITKDPTSQDLLPVDDSLWDMGVSHRSFSHLVRYQCSINKHYR